MYIDIHFQSVLSAVAILQPFHIWNRRDEVLCDTKFYPLECNDFPLRALSVRATLSLCRIIHPFFCMFLPAILHISLEIETSHPLNYRKLGWQTINHFFFFCLAKKKMVLRICILDANSFYLSLIKGAITIHTYRFTVYQHTA